MLQWRFAESGSGGLIDFTLSVLVGGVPAAYEIARPSSRPGGLQKPVLDLRKLSDGGGLYHTTVIHSVSIAICSSSRSARFVCGRAKLYFFRIEKEIDPARKTGRRQRFRPFHGKAR